MTDSSRGGRGERRARRGVSILDLLVLVGGVGVGFGWLRGVRPATERPFPTGLGRYEPLGRYLVEPYGRHVFPLVAGLMVATLVLRFLPPRPSRDGLVVQTGWTACLAATLVFGVEWSYLGALVVFLRLSDPASVSWAVAAQCLQNYGLGFAFFDPGLFILTAWITQFIVRKPTPTGDWVDRLGRALGWLCLVASCFRILYEIIERLRGWGFIPA